MKILCFVLAMGLHGLAFAAPDFDRPQKPVGYNKTLRQYLFLTLHGEELESDSPYVEEVYCQEKIYLKKKGNRYELPEHSVVNIEHTYPQSKGAKREPAKSDLHHLYPSDSRANSVRGNLSFGEVDEDRSESVCGASAVGAANTRGLPVDYSLRVFEPPDQHKGNIARALFYAKAVYGYKMEPVEEHFLLLWNRLDPPDDLELWRNGEVEAIQGNRNPFVDDFTLVEEMFEFSRRWSGFLSWTHKEASRKFDFLID